MMFPPLFAAVCSMSTFPLLSSILIAVSAPKLALYANVIWLLPSSGTSTIPLEPIERSVPPLTSMVPPLSVPESSDPFMFPVGPSITT